MDNFRGLLRELRSSLDLFGHDEFPWVNEDQPLGLDFDDWSEESDAELGAWLDRHSYDQQDWGVETRYDFEKLAWYVPIHNSADQAGIYLTERGIRHYAYFYRDATRMSGLRLTNRESVLGAIDLLLRHEIFHHEVESFAIRFQIATGTSSLYPLYRQRVQALSAGRDGVSDENLEEALASAREYFVTAKTLWGARVRHRDELKAIQSHLLHTFGQRPPGYRKAIYFTNAIDFQEHASGLMNRIVNPQTNYSPGWHGKFGFKFERGLFNSELLKTWTLVRSEKDEPMPSAFSIPTSRVEHALRSAGYEVVPRGGKGSHTKWRHPRDGSFVTVPHRKDQEGYKALTVIARKLGHKNLRGLSAAL